MNLSAQDINAQFLMLPEPEQQKVIDFILAQQTIPLNKTTPQPEGETELSPLYQAFEQAGFIGCMETDEQLSSTYKDKIDFASKYNIGAAE